MTEEWLRLQYKNAVNALENAKRRQWQIPYYILLLYAAIIGIHKILESPPHSVEPFDRTVLFIIAVIIHLVGAYHIIDCHGAMTEYRKFLKTIENTSDNFISLFEEEKPVKEDRFRYYVLSFTVFFLLIISAGFVFVLRYMNCPSSSVKAIVFINGMIIIGLIIWRKMKVNTFEKSLIATSESPTHPPQS